MPKNDFTVFGERSVAQNFIQTGWNFPYNINPVQVRTNVLGGGTVTHENNAAVASVNGTAGDVAFIRTDGSIAYTPGIGAIARFTCVFDDPQDGLLQLIGVGDARDGWFFGYNGLKFGILRRSNVTGTVVDEWTYQDSWNIARRADLNPQNGNVYQIAFQWLGYGMQYFAIEEKGGNLEEVHHLEYAGKNKNTSVDIPSLPISMGIACPTVGLTASIKSPSAVALSQGEPFPISFTVPIGYSRIQSISPGTSYVFSILNPETYEGKENKLYLDSALLTFTNDTNKSVVVSILFNAILTGASFSDIAPGVTLAQADISATSFTNGLEVVSFAVQRAQGISLDLTSIFERSRLWSESQLTVLVEATGSGEIATAYTFRSRM
jgi:hypothetical protein